MADYDSTARSSSPQIDAADILDAVEEIVRECAPVLFPFRTIRRKAKSAAERRHITETRVQLYERSQGICELQISPKCWRQITWDSMHAAHVVSRARLGTWDLSNLMASCPECHSAEHNAGGKPCPPKNGGAL